MPIKINALKITTKIMAALPDIAGGLTDNKWLGLKKYFKYVMLVQILIHSDNFQA